MLQVSYAESKLKIAVLRLDVDTRAKCGNKTNSTRDSARSALLCSAARDAN